MSYIRVIPRDLFNEAKLLKCLGALYIASERRNDLIVENENMGDAEPFDIHQNELDGSIFVANVNVVFRGHTLHCATPLNSKLAYPLRAEFNDELVYVFDDHGGLSDDFLALIPSTHETAAKREGWTGPHKDQFGATYFKDETDGQTWAGATWEELARAFDIEG